MNNINAYLRKLTALLAAGSVMAAGIPAQAAEVASLSVGKIKDLNLRIYGFVETDFISDSTQGFNEEQGNNPVPTRTTIGGAADNYAGIHHRTQMSVRNSRLGFDLTLPKGDSGLETEGIFELDFLGNNAPNTPPGTGGSSISAQSERDFFNNPAVRVRHAYLNLTRNEWNAKIGQYWSLLGWQPYYFPGEVIVQPGPGQLYRRFAQARITRTDSLNGGDWTLESAADAAKPAEMNSGVPEFHAGLRLASTKIKSASVGGAGSSLVGLSAAVSGALIPVRSNIGNQNGKAIALDVWVPLIASSDGKDKADNLSLGGEFMDGKGVGGLEFSGLSAGVKGISPTTPGAGTTVDSGIAGVNNDGGLELIRFRTFRSHLQYVFPNPRWSASTGYAQVEGVNLADFSNSLNGNTPLSFTPKIQFGYVSLFYDPQPWLRFAAEWNETRDTYNDGANRHATNNRVWLASYFMF